MSTETRRGETGTGRGLFMVVALIVVTLAVSAPAAAQSAKSQYNAQDPIDCQPGQCAPASAEDAPVLADVPKKAGSSGARSFRGFTQTLGGDGSTDIRPAAAAETRAPAGEPELAFDPTDSRGTDTGSSEATDDVSGSGAAGDARPENSKPRVLPDTGGVPFAALGALAALVAGGLLIRRIAR